MMHARNVLAVCSSVIFGASAAVGATRTWTGNGDGCRLGDSANWSAVPAPGDALVFTNRTDALLTLSNDLGSAEAPFAAAALTFTGGGAIHLTGNPLGLQIGDSYFSCPLTNDVDIVLTKAAGSTQKVKYSFYLGTSKDSAGNAVDGYLVQNGAVRGSGELTVVLNAGTCLAGSQRSSFNGDILIPDGDIYGLTASAASYNGVEYVFRGRVVAKSVNYGARGTNTGAFRGIMRFYSDENDIGDLYLVSKQAYAYSATAFGPNVTIHRGGNTESNSKIYLPNGVRTTIAGFGQNDQWTAAVTGANGNLISTESEGVTAALTTLTAHGAGDDTNDFILNGRLSFVWDPTDASTVDFRSSRASTMQGTITVRSGTMRTSAAGATFRSVPEISVAEGAVFGMDGGATSALTGVGKIVLADGATFRLGANEVTPFAANKAVFHLFGDAKIDLACAVTTPVSVFVDGVPVAANTYTTAGWLSGTGSIVVADPVDHFWTGAADSDWNKAGNWVNGVPQFADGKPAHVAKPGTVAVSVSADAPTVKHLDVENRDGRTTLNVAAALVVSNGTLTVGKDAEIAVGAGGAFKYDVARYANDTTTPTLTLRENGRITVNGGVFDLVNGEGNLSIGGGNPAVTSTLSVVSGTCNIGVRIGDRAAAFRLNRGGRIEMTGGTLNYTCPYEGGGWNIMNGFNMYGGIIDLSGTALMELKHVAAHAFGSGTVRIHGNDGATLKSALTLKSGRRFGPLGAGESLEIDVSDGGLLELSGDSATSINGVAGSWTRLTVRDSGAANMGNSVWVGNGAGTTGEIVLRDNATCSDKYYTFTFGRGGSADGVATGVLMMSGGTLTVRSSEDADYPTLRGLVFGDGASSTATGEIWNRGLGYISGGIVNVARRLCVGDGNAYGLVEQSGGTMNMGNKPATIGDHCGTGVYRMTGGTFNGGTGTVSIGLNGGKGTLEFGAGNGSFAAANLNLSGSNSMLKFVLGADGSVIRPNVTSMLTIGTGAKLVVDSTAYRGAAVTLMTFGAASGSFAAADISLVGAPNGKLTQSGSSLRFIPEPHGLVLIVR